MTDAASNLFGPGTEPGPRVPSDRDQRLTELYKLCGRTVDDLPYTPEFEDLYQRSGGDGTWQDRRACFRRLQGLRKANRLPAMGLRGESGRPRISADEESLLADMVRQRVGTLGQRDQLLYAPEFDALREAFNARTGRSLDAHDLWRLIAKIAKAGRDPSA